MTVQKGAAILFAALACAAAAFQVALMLGAPWGAYAMGGAFPGQFPASMRMAAGVQSVILLLWAGIVLARADVALRAWSRAARWLVWVVVAFSAISLLLNLITPSAGERLLWAPVGFLMLVTSVVVATSRPASST
jgi:hypothetical protein